MALFKTQKSHLLVGEILYRRESITEQCSRRKDIVSWGGFAPDNEIKGMISPIIFPGLPDFWYVELRIPTAY